MEETFTISHLSKNEVPIAGSHKSYDFLAKLVRQYNITPDGKSIKNTPEYKISTLETFIDLYKKEGGDDDIDDLKKKKLEIEIKNLDKDLQKKDLQIEQLKDSLVDSQEVADYLVSRRAVELAILRRVLFVQMPIEIPGLPIPKAREKAQQYYNELVQTYLQSETLWNEKYDLKAGKELENRIGYIIYKVEQTAASGSQASGSQAPTACSGSANNPVV